MKDKSQEYSLPYVVLCDCLKEIAHDSDRFCPHYVDYKLIRTKDDGETSIYNPVGSRVYKFQPMCVELGIKTLRANMRSDGYVRNVDAERLLFQAFHEEAHVWQYSVGYMQPGFLSTDLMKDMARMSVVSSYFKDLSKLWYALDMSEMMANQYASVKAKEFVEKKSLQGPRFCDLDMDRRAREYCRNLYAPSWSNMQFCNTAEDVSGMLSKMLVLAPYRKRFQVHMSSLFQDDSLLSAPTRDFVHDKVAFESVLFSDNGVEELDKLCNYISKKDPSLFRGLLCIRDEYLSSGVGANIERLSAPILGVRPQKFVSLDTTGTSSVSVQTGVRDASDLGRLLGEMPTGRNKHNDGPDF